MEVSMNGDFLKYLQQAGDRGITIPQMMKSMGHGVREFKKAVSGVSEPDQREDSAQKDSAQQS